MGKQRTITIHSPLAGVVNSTAFQQQPPYSAVASMNFWPMDVGDGRYRLCNRPRLASLGGPGAVRGYAESAVNVSKKLYRSLIVIAGSPAATLYEYSAPTSGSYSWGTGKPVGSIPAGQVQVAAWGKYIFIPSNTPKYYDLADNLVKAWNTANPPAGARDALGTVPANCRYAISWSDRVVCTGSEAEPNIIYMSRQGDPWDFDFSAEDDGRAFYLRLDTPMRSLISGGANCLLMCGDDTIHILRGDPTFGGQLDTISHVLGPLGTYAWSYLEDDTILMLTRNGLILMPSGCGGQPHPVLQGKTPDSLLGLDLDFSTCTMAYDVRYHGVHIHVSGTNAQAWFLDWGNQAFWKVDYAERLSTAASCLMRYNPLDSPDASGVLFAGASDVCRLDRTTDPDVFPYAQTPYITLGPIKLSQTPYQRGIVTRMTVRFSNSDTTDIGGTIRLCAGRDGEDAYARSLLGDAALNQTYKATVTQLQNNRFVNPRIGGHALCIKIAMSNRTKKLVVDEMDLVIEDSGEQR